MALNHASPRPNLNLPSVDGRIEKISNLVQEDDDLNTKMLPGLAHLLDDYLDPKVPVTSEDFTRRLLMVFRKSTDNTYQDLLAGYNDNEQAALEAFVKGEAANKAGIGLEYSPSIAARQELGKLQKASLAEKMEREFQDVKEGVKSWFGKEAEEVSRLVRPTEMVEIATRAGEGPLEVSFRLIGGRL